MLVKFKSIRINGEDIMGTCLFCNKSTTIKYKDGTISYHECFSCNSRYYENFKTKNFYYIGNDDFGMFVFKKQLPLYLNALQRNVSLKFLFEIGRLSNLRLFV